MNYDIVDIFYSLKGEGRYTGHPMAFVRLADCNLNCAWCDTDYIGNRRTMTVDDIISEVALFNADRVVITGGEPLMQECRELVETLHDHGYTVHLETNGTMPPNADFDWIAVSPKSKVSDLDDSLFSLADEVKFIVGWIPDWKEYIKEVTDRFPHLEMDKDYVTLYVMPLANGLTIDDYTTKLAIDYALNHPNFWFCLQEHKVLKIK